MATSDKCFHSWLRGRFSKVFRERDIFLYRRSSELAGLCWWTCVKQGVGRMDAACGYRLMGISVRMGRSVSKRVTPANFSWQRRVPSEHCCSDGGPRAQGPRPTHPSSDRGPEATGAGWPRCPLPPPTPLPGALLPRAALPGQGGTAEVGAEGRTGSAGARSQPLRPVPLSARRPPCRRGGGSGRREKRRLDRHRHQHRAVRGEPCRAVPCRATGAGQGTGAVRRSRGEVGARGRTGRGGAGGRGCPVSVVPRFPGAARRGLAGPLLPPAL